VTRVGLISDLHGNLLALDAVLAELGREELDGLVCLGDIAVGPQPRETLSRLRELECPVVMGNWDEWFLEPKPPRDDELAVRLAEIAAFWADCLTDDDREFMRSFVPRLELGLDGQTALCFHGSPRSNEDWIFATTPDDEVAEMFGENRADVMIGGHTHIQLVRRFEDTVLVNAGSVGLPFSSWWPHQVRIAPWAEYAIVGYEEGRLRVDLRRTTYDVDTLLDISLESGMPHARWWCDSWRTDTAGRSVSS
jgi:putative phosphoesterase